MCPFYAIADCRIPQIEDAEIRNKTYRHGDKLIVACHEGFKIRYPDLYNMVSLCRDDGTWDNLPLCQGGRSREHVLSLAREVEGSRARPALVSESPHPPCGPRQPHAPAVRAQIGIP